VEDHDKSGMWAVPLPVTSACCNPASACQGRAGSPLPGALSATTQTWPHTLLPALSRTSNSITVIMAVFAKVSPGTHGLLIIYSIFDLISKKAAMCHSNSIWCNIASLLLKRCLPAQLVILPDRNTFVEHWVSLCPERSQVICMTQGWIITATMLATAFRRPGLSDAAAMYCGSSRYCVEDAVSSTRVQPN